jgi:transcriptional regulator with XRE-family HTH domain
MDWLVGRSILLSLLAKRICAMGRAETLGQATRKSAAPVDTYVGGRARMRRKMLGMSQQNLAAALGITFQQVQKYEKGANRIGASRLQKMSEVLKVPISYFFDGWPGDEPSPPVNGEQTELSDITKFMASSDGITLIQAFVRIKSLTLRRQLVQLAVGIADQAD